MNTRQGGVSSSSPNRQARLGAVLLVILGLLPLSLATGDVRGQSTGQTTGDVDPCSLFPPVFPAGVPDTFLEFLELKVPLADQAAAEKYATAYYRAVDPKGERTTFPDWLVKNGFIEKASEIQHGPNGDALVKRDAFALFVNTFDLGVTRRYYQLTDAKGNIATYTENYRCLRDAKLRQNVLTIVGTEYRPAADGSNPDKRFITFYAFDENDNRALTVDLDGRGQKAIPQMCQVCHGGKPKRLDANGNFPNRGDVGASMLPWDMSAFAFDTSDPSLSRAAQESSIKNLNKTAYSTYRKTLKFDEVAGYSRPSVLAELVQGWYGGPSLPRATFDESFTPKGWLPPYAPTEAKALYQDVILPNCRACHTTRETSLDFASYKGFVVFNDATRNLVFNSVANPKSDSGSSGDDGVMPIALQTFNNFWNSTAHERLRKFLDTH